MVITSDILLKGQEWSKLIDSLSGIFKTRTNYQLFILCLSIGIHYDKRKEDMTDDGENPRSVPRNVIVQHDKGKIDFMFQAAILTSETVDFDEERRLELAFDEKATGFNKMAFLVSFANYGASALLEQIGNTDIDTMDSIKEFLVSPIEGTNYILPSDFSDDLLLDPDYNPET